MIIDINMERISLSLLIIFVGYTKTYEKTMYSDFFVVSIG